MTVNKRYLVALLFLSGLGCDSSELCDPGTLGCPCLSDSTCRLDTLACMDGTCVEPAQVCEGGVCAPPVPKCYTPCANDVVEDDGTVRRCSQEGLMDGCVGDAYCDRGSCVPRIGMTTSGLKMAPGTCAIETDCPDFQTCIQDRCYSNCDDDSECPNGKQCHRKVCRDTCADDDPCPSDRLACSFEGVCLPLTPPGEAPEPSDVAEFVLETTAIAFNTNNTTSSFVITNPSDRAVPITIRKSEQRVQQDDGTLDVRTAADGQTPLVFLTMGVGTPLRVQELPITVPAGQSIEVQLANARNESLSSWNGRIQVVAEGVATKDVLLSYTETVPGRWAGKIYYFGNFEDGARPAIGLEPLDLWRRDRSNLGLVDAIPNAFLQAWGRFRNSAFSLVEMEALLQATINGTWQSERVMELCEEAGYGRGAACAPFGGSGSGSVIPYTSAANIDRVPSGVIELDFVMNLADAPFEDVSDPTVCSAPGLVASDPRNCFTGRVVTTESLQYGGNPKVHLRFEDDPTSCQAQGDAGCIAYLADFGAEISVGARYVPGDDDVACTAVENVDRREEPWLVPSFAAPGGDEDKRECRDSLLPYAGESQRNQIYAAANPVPDGRPRVRRLELVDGIMIEQHEMLLIVRETVDAFHGGDDPLTSYAYIALSRQDRDLEPEELVGNRPVDERDNDTSQLGLACSSDLIGAVTRRAPVPVDRLTRRERLNLARAVVTGRTSTAALDVASLAEESIHSVCIWSEDAVVNNDPSTPEDPIRQQRQVIDAGPDGTTPCPGGAVVFYFALSIADFMASDPAFDPARLTCNFYGGAGEPETCLTEVRRWVLQGRNIRLTANAEDWLDVGDRATDDTFSLAWECSDPGRTACSEDRFALMSGKTFFAENMSEVFFNRIETDIHDAFRYRTQFVSRSGRNVGFVPSICAGNDNLVPYCYDPEVVAALQDRVDCALALYHYHLDENGLDSNTANLLRDYLVKNFGQLQTDNPTGDPIVEHGFERLYAELLIMLGDDALTASFASRFDLAGTRQLAFEGSKFEAGGIDVSGIAGFELYKLYQASQYYDYVLDRFYSLSPYLWRDITGGHPIRYISQTTVTAYLGRVIRASTQRARVFTEIARRYVSLNRQDLARSVLERSYTRAYQESIILSEIMRRIQQIVSPSQVDQVVFEIEQAQRAYRVAMLDMRRRYDSIDDQITFFGLRPDYIPFPALDEDDVNGFEVILGRAFDTMEVAAEQEERALSSTREFDVDEAEFQSELVQIRNNYEAQLGEICGTFQSEDGRVLPAISRYSYLDPNLAELNDPCGGNSSGTLWLKYADVETRVLELQRVRQEIANVQSAAKIAEDRVAAQCRLIQEDVRAFLEFQGAVNGYQQTIDGLEFGVNQADKVLSFMTELTSRVADAGDDDTPWAAAAGAAGFSTFAASAVIHFALTATFEAIILSNQSKIRELEKQYEAYQIGRECTYLTVDLAFTLREIHLDMALLELDVLNALWNLQVDIALLGQIDNERKRVEAEWETAEQLALDVAAAKNDPNIRIYKNDAVINADRSFDRALREAYRATKMFEYYTSQSYPDFEKLFFVRMVDAGDINLRAYMAQLQDDFFAFEDQFGNPDTRVAAISLRDSVFNVARYSSDDTGRVLTAEERAEAFRERIQDPSLLDDNGWLTVKFDTNFAQLSPLTHNHKILFIEIEFLGDVGGDQVGRAYLRQIGTGVVRDADGDRLYYTFPPKTAVMNPVLNGNRDFGQDSDGAIAGPVRTIFRSFRFRERPYVNTAWEFVLNQRTETVNEDINLDGLDDIQINVFYTDFTNPGD
ncbi:MAG: EB domain-containing protein [Deltaproteobacteria bacterium]